MAAIRLERVTKKYDGFTAVDEISFTVEKGEIFGLLGPNGSGKTTISEMIVGLKKPSSGEISVVNLNPFFQRKRLAGIIGVQLDYTALPWNIKVKEAVELFASFHNIKSSERIRFLLERFGLANKKERLYKYLSQGEKQRLGMILACLHNPRVLILDEPFSRLDPVARQKFFDYLKGCKKENKTVFINTHNITEADKLCDRIGIIHKGKLCAIDSPQSLVKNIGFKFRITCPANFSLKINSPVTKVVHTTVNTYFFTNQPQELIHILQKSNQNFTQKNVDLTDVFLLLVGEEFND